ncbi:MAG TPA: DUF4159 domain-containing protein [Vicinamibacterales bacterium]|nr:DUF4159 domain-containing protein [Vicinamibacterales bacterium]
MSSAWRKALIVAGVVAAATTSTTARDPKVDYDGRSAFTRIQYGTQSLTSGRFRREPTWAHDFPRGDFNFLKILNELTFVRSVIDEGNILTLDDPDLGRFPVAYMAEPGFWVPSDTEVEGLRSYLKKGGFIIFDDFRGDHIDNLVYQMRRVIPEATFQKLDATHPIFHSFFEIDTLDPRSGYYADAGDTEWLGIFEDNDPRKRLIAIANNNHDLGELWEYSDTGFVPVDLSNEAYKFGVNYVMYALTH